MVLAAVLRLCLLLLFAAAAAPAAAQSCSVDFGAAGSVNFLTYNPASGSPTVATASVTLTCTYNGSGGAQKVDWNMQLTNGSSGNCNARRLPGPGGNTLNYNIYQNTVANGVWGNAGCGAYPAGQITVSPGGGNNVRSVTNVLYGQIPMGQFVPAGTYNENLVLTVTF
jgi:spore coat protein U-like protein